MLPLLSPFDATATAVPRVWQLIVRLELIGATLEDAAHGSVASIAGLEGTLESFGSEASEQTQDALRLTVASSWSCM